ncbi:DNA topoisomerase 3-alpha [Camellia lanceoleosa]|uniref:DNA topoisomerase 3-alpha n=1 Tax=Camellia lanceoleosa TaxID=1840588 RepID=A0ACC0H8D4_9ERIC|nr:DNA topoisomerase 3-alpha [Camellia lanceoleosa]
MRNNRSSRNQGRWNASGVDKMFCNVCGRRRLIHTAWTDTNPGRRFLSFPNSGCNHFTWIDPPMCDRAVQIIPGLLKKLNKMEAQLKKRTKRERKLWICLVLSWLVVGIWFVM